MNKTTTERPTLSEQAQRAAQIPQLQHEAVSVGVQALSAVVAALPPHLPKGWGREGGPDWSDLTDEEQATELFRGWLALAGVRQQGYLEVYVPGYKLTLGPRSVLVMER